MYGRLGEPEGRSGRVPKISHPMEFDPRTVQSAASRYTYWAILAHEFWLIRISIIQNYKYVPAWWELPRSVEFPLSVRGKQIT
jgi:hypothetical protein